MERTLTGMELLIDGYNKLEEKKDTKEGDVTNFEGEKVDRELSAVEKMAKGYSTDGSQKEEVNIDLNDVKEGDGK